MSQKTRKFDTSPWMRPNKGEKVYVSYIEAAGFTEDDIKVEVKDGYVHVTGKRVWNELDIEKTIDTSKKLPVVNYEKITIEFDNGFIFVVVKPKNKTYLEPEINLSSITNNNSSTISNNSSTKIIWNFR